MNRKLAIFAACGAAAGIGSVATAQPYTVNVSGATLQQNLFTAFANTNDFIDADGNPATQAGLGTGQLAPSPITALNGWWSFQYTAVGSGNGLQDLDRAGSSVGFATGADADATPLELELFSGDVDNGFANLDQYINGAAGVGPFNPNNAGGRPVRSLTDGSYATTLGTGVGTGVQIDIAPLDVASIWFITQPGAAEWFRIPGETGYGDNPTQSYEGAQSNKLKTLLNTNVNRTNPDANTLWDTEITWAPVATLVNYGVGYEEIDVTDLQYLFATGRLKSGENIVAVTRDSGSGTRNDYMNGICVDPSFGRGDNGTPRSSSSVNDLIGPNYNASNRGGSSRMRASVGNHRLAIGYTGAEQAINNSFIANGQGDVMAVRNDHIGGVGYHRPNIDAVVDNGVEGYKIAAPAVFTTIGNPILNDAADGGWGWDAGEVGAPLDSLGNPIPGSATPMANRHAAAYVNNVRRSTEAFNSLPGNAALFTPGEFLATQFIPVPAVDEVRDLPSGQCEFAANPALNQNLQDFVRTGANSGSPNNVLGRSEYYAFGSGPLGTLGRVPSRTSGEVYSDTNGATATAYEDVNGTVYAAGAMVPAGSAICGDFDGNGLRNWDDAEELVEAYNVYNSGGAWTGSGTTIFELLGDFNGDGNFGQIWNGASYDPDTTDVRYWCDGLALDPATGDHNRMEGFTRVDNAAGGNFFGTTLATGKSYVAGDSRGDLSGSVLGATPGWNPNGADGVVDAADIDYTFDNFGDFIVLSEAINMDLSCDMNCDKIVDINDVCDIVINVLGTQFGDADLNGVLDDLATVNANQGLTPAGWSDGDFNGDNIVNATDLDIYNGVIDPCAGSLACSPADVTTQGAGAGDPGFGVPDGLITSADIQFYVNLFVLQDLGADLTTQGAGAGDPGFGVPDGQVTNADIQFYVNLFVAGCP